MSVTRFCELTGIPRATWYRWRAAGASSPGPWSTPAQDRVEADAKALAAAWEGWGHRKLAELKRVGIDDIAPAAVSDSTMYRVLSRNGLCLPANYTAEVRQAAGVRHKAFICPPVRRNRLWQADFSEHETAAGGRWNLGGVADAWDQVSDQLAARFPKTGPLMDGAKADVLAFAAFPRAHWQKIWSTNPLERINKEIKRRSRVVGIFPNETSAIRLVGAILADLHDEWQATDRRYLSEDSMSLLYPERDTIATAELTVGNHHRGSTQKPTT